MSLFGISKRRRLGHGGQAEHLFVFSGGAEAQPNEDQAPVVAKEKREKEKLLHFLS